MVTSGCADLVVRLKIIALCHILNTAHDKIGTARVMSLTPALL
jgi:hypothetical protein